MKSIGVVLVILVSVYGVVYGADQFVTAEKPSIADIEAYAKETVGKYPNFVVLGIHQEGNTADVYYQYQRSGFAPHVGTFKLIRFNSGKWYCPEKEEFVSIQ